MGFQLTDRVALVTGANRGIGKEIVKHLISKGVKKVYLAVRNTSSVEDQVAEFGDRVVPLILDLNNPSSIEEAASQAKDVELLVNNAGYLEPASLFDPDFEGAFKNELEVNALGALRVAKAFDAVLRNKPSAALVQLNSVVSLRNFDGITGYSASKAASYTFTQALRSYWATSNIEVVSVHPGPIQTDMARQLGLEDGASSPTFVASSIVSALEEGRFHAFPDPVAQEFGSSYESFGKNVVEADFNVGH